MGKEQGRVRADLSPTAASSCPTLTAQRFTAEEQLRAATDCPHAAQWADEAFMTDDALVMSTLLQPRTDSTVLPQEVELDRGVLSLYQSPESPEEVRSLKEKKNQKLQRHIFVYDTKLLILYFSSTTCMVLPLLSTLVVKTAPGSPESQSLGPKVLV